MSKRYCKGFQRASSLCASSWQTYVSAKSFQVEKNRSEHQLNHADNFAHSLAEPIFWIAAALCVIAELAILRAAFIPRSHASETGPIPNSPRGAEMMWAIIPAIGLAFLLAATWRAVH